MFELFDVSGKCMFSQELKGGQSQISIAAFANGIYIAKLSNASFVEFRKVIRN